MPWGRLDDTLYDHHKVEALPDAIRLACVGLQALAISWSNRQLTDGFVPESRIQKLGGTSRHRDALVVVHMWETAEGGIQIHDFLHYNKSKVQVEAERAAARTRMQTRRGSREVQANTTPNNERSSREVQANTERSSREVRDSRARSRANPGPARPVPEESLQRESLPSARTTERADVQALHDRGWKRVTKAQRAVLDEVLERHDVAGPEFAANVIRVTPPDRDPLAEVLAADTAWQQYQRRKADDDERAWHDEKARDRAKADAQPVADLEFVG